MTATPNEDAGMTVDDIIATARSRKQNALSEYDAKRVLREYGIPVTREDAAAAPGKPSGPPKKSEVRWP